MVVAVPSTDDTRGVVDAEAITAIKHGATFVNVGRGGVVDETALIQALREARSDKAAGRLEGHGPGRQIGVPHLRRDSQTCAPVASESSPDGRLISASARASSASTSSWTPDFPSSVLSSGMGCESSEASPGAASSHPDDIGSGTNRIVPLVDGTMLAHRGSDGAAPHLRP